MNGCFCLEPWFLLLVSFCVWTWFYMRACENPSTTIIHLNTLLQQVSLSTDLSTWCFITRFRRRLPTSFSVIEECLLDSKNILLQTLFLGHVTAFAAKGKAWESCWFFWFFNEQSPAPSSDSVHQENLRERRRRRKKMKIMSFVGFKRTQNIQFFNGNICVEKAEEVEGNPCRIRYDWLCIDGCFYKPRFSLKKSLFGNDRRTLFLSLSLSWTNKSNASCRQKPYGLQSSTREPLQTERSYVPGHLPRELSAAKQSRRNVRTRIRWIMTWLWQEFFLAREEEQTNSPTRELGSLDKKKKKEKSHISTSSNSDSELVFFST